MTLDTFARANNRAQYRLVMMYLADMTEKQTLVMYSGHPLGLFPSHKRAPRVVITNGMVVPNYSGRDEYVPLGVVSLNAAVSKLLLSPPSHVSCCCLLALLALLGGAATSACT